MDYLFIDIETRSKADLGIVGTVNYAKDKTTEIVVIGYRLSKWQEAKKAVWVPGQRIPKELVDFKGLIVAHNWAFEYHILTEIMVKKLKLLPSFYSNTDNYTCTMSTARRCGLQGALATLSITLNLKTKKLSALGDKLINEYSKPHKGLFRSITPEVLNEFKAYVLYDVAATEELFYLLPKLHEDKIEWPIFQFAKQKQVRGFLVDKHSVEAVTNVYEKFVEQATVEAEKLCGRTKGDALVITSPTALLPWLNDRLDENNRVANTQNFTLQKLAKEAELTDEVKKALKLRRALSRASVKKLYPYSNQIDSKNIASHQTLYHKAGTGREAGFGIQPQNFPRLKCDFDADYSLLQSGKFEYDQVPEIVSRMQRGFIIPRKGKTFVVGDLSAIEARLTFWFADEQEALDVYRRNEDIYKVFASYIYRITVNDVTKDQRSVGKTSVLSLGYGSGPGKFQTMLEQNGIKLGVEDCIRIVKIYRVTYKKVVRQWYDLDKAFRNLIESRSGVTIKVGKVVLGRSAKTIWIQLPDGKKLYYFKPAFHTKTVVDKNGNVTREDVVIYQSNEGMAEIWGGTLFNNIVQGTARNVIMVHSLEAEKKGVDVVLNVHDEIVGEVLERQAKTKLATLEKIMSTNPSWLVGVPLTAECVISDRYKKI